MAATSLSSLQTVEVGYDYDVFLSYHSVDRELIKPIVSRLEAAGLKVWWDQDPRCMPAGAIWMVEMESGIRRSRTTAVCIGPQIQGYWQREEYMLALNIQRERSNPVIPVILPGVRTDKIPGFLSLRSAADFSGGLENSAEFDRLVAGVQGAPATRTSSPPPLSADFAPDIAASLKELSDYLARDNITFFVGSDTAPAPTRDCDISLSLLSELGIESAPPSILPPVDIAALYYAASKRDLGLEDTVVNLLQDKARLASDLHERLAGLLPRVMNFPRRRGRKTHRQLIVSMSLDTCLERALARRRMKFVRIAARRDRGTLCVNDYRFKDLLADGGVIGPDDIRYPLANDENQDEFIRSCGAQVLPSDAVAAKFLGSDACLTPIVFKPRGSQDLGGCAISSVHLFDIARRLAGENSLLDALTDIADNTASVFFGLRFIGAELRLCWQCLLRGDLASYPRYLYQPAPRSDSDDCFERSEARIWDRIKARSQERGLTIVGHHPADALALLAGRLDAIT